MRRTPVQPGAVMALLAGVACGDFRHDLAAVDTEGPPADVSAASTHDAAEPDVAIGADDVAAAAPDAAIDLALSVPQMDALALARDAGPTADAATPPMDTPPPPPPEPATCAEVKARQPSAGDGLYSLRGGVRAYCDMQQKVALCTDKVEAHAGVTRDGSKLAFKLSSQLDEAKGECRVWAVRDSAQGHPIDALVAATGLSLTTCTALGFKSNGAMGACKYGANPDHGRCGYPGTSYVKWANSCSGCDMNDGIFAKYVLQGKIYVSEIPWNYDGSVVGRCRVK